VEAVRDASNAIIDFRWIAANERARLHVAEQAGRDLEWLDGHLFSDVFAAESAAQERDILIPLVEGQEAAVFTGFAAHGGASIRHSFTATPVLDGLCLVHHVETDDEARERRLVASEERLRLALDGSRDAVWDWDIDSDRVFLEMPDSASEQYPLLAGSRHQTRDEAFRVVHPDDVAGFRARMQAHLDGQADVFEMVHRVQHADNAVHWRLSRGRTVARDGRGRPVRVVGTSIDITQRRASEEELERAKEAAEAANRTKGEFLANVSHELRTPLNTIIGLLEIVLDEPLPPTARSHVNDALTAAESLLRIIRDLLDFSAMEAGRFTVIEKPFDLTLAVDALVRSMNYDSAARGVTLAATIDDEVPRRIVGDPNRLRQVLTNLVGNALKFTENGRVDVTFALDASATHDAPGRVRVDVTDTGPGIEPDKLERIFAPFEQADTSTTRRFGGTGLGLAIVRRLVERMGGEVNVLSEPGRGSTFRFTFAFHAVDEEPSSSSVLRVLLVSGDVRRRQALRDALECESVQVTAIRPEDLVGAGRSSRPRDVLLWDVALLEPEGIVRGVVEACAAALRDLAPAPDRVLLLGDPSAATVRGAEAIVPRDLPAARLAERLRETTRRRDEVAEAPIGALTVLVAEDSPVNQHVIRQILQKLGHEVVTVDDGRAAVEACAARRWDLVLMDVQMPELDGFEATQRIRERERETNESPVPILALTADARESTRELCLRSGMDGWLTKPIRRADLARAIDPIGARRLVGTDEVC
jgi:two-component system sensor histidine kinase/response regulator